MLLFQESTLTIFALLVAVPKSQLPPVMTIGLTAICAIAVAFAFLGEFRRHEGKRRKDPSPATVPSPVIVLHEQVRTVRAQNELGRTTP
jgi:hypothetical protein